MVKFGNLSYKAEFKDCLYQRFSIKGEFQHFKEIGITDVHIIWDAPLESRLTF